MSDAPEQPQEHKLNPQDSVNRPVTHAEQNYNAQINGGGAIAQGKDTKAVGAGGVLVEGDNTGTINTGVFIGFSAEQVAALIVEVKRADQPKTWDGRHPYIGLAAFQESDAGFFFGREQLVNELLQRIIESGESRFVCIAGPSGSGKSSLAQAGMIHALRHGSLDGSDKWLFMTLTPRGDPIEQLALAMARLAKNPAAAEYLRESGLRDASALHRQVESLLSHDRNQRAVIFVDQFEEVFTQTKDENQRRAFIDLLTRAAQVEDGRIVILLAMRSDFVSQCSAYPALRASINQQFQLVGAMAPEELARAIVLPALEVGVKIDPELVSRVIADMKGESGALPLMQFALKDLFDAQQPKKGDVVELTLKDYLERGGLQQALERHADAAFAKLTPQRQQLARNVFSRLVEIGRGTVDTRRTATFAELTPTSADPHEVEAVVQALADARLVTTDKRSVTLVHEALIDVWPWLRRLVNENREAIALANEISADAAEWEIHDRDTSYLYAGAKLDFAREQLAAKNLALSDQAQSFIQTGIKRATKQRRQQVLSVLLVIALIAGGLVGFAVLQAQRAQEQTQRTEDLRRSEATAVAAQATAEAQRIQAEGAKATAIAEQKLSRSRELSALALSQIKTDPERGILLALEADKAAHTFESEDVLRQGLAAFPLWNVLRGNSAEFLDAQFSPDDKLIIATGSDNALHIWDLTTNTPREIAALRGHTERINSTDIASNGDLIVTAGEDGSALIWNLINRQQIFALTAHDGPVSYAGFSPDGKLIVTTGADRTARIWNTQTGNELAVMANHTDTIRSANFSPDSKRVATASADGTAHIWESASGKTIQVLRMPGTSVNMARFSPDGQLVVTAGDDGTAQLWNASSGEAIRALNHGDHGVASAQFTRNGQYLLTSSGNGVIRKWSVDGREIRSWSSTVGRHEDFVYNFLTGKFHATSLIIGAIGPLYVGANDELAIVAGFFETKILSLSSSSVRIGKDGATARTCDFEDDAFSLPGAHNGRFSFDGKRAATVGQDGHIWIWNVATKGELFAVRGVDYCGEDAHFSPDSESIVATEWVWDIPTQWATLMPQQDNPIVNDQPRTYSQDGRIAIRLDQAGTVQVLEANSGRQLAVLRGYDAEIRTAEFSPDDSLVVTVGNGGTVQLWSTETFREVTRLRPSSSDPQSGTHVKIDLSPNGRYILMLFSDTPRVYLVRHDDVVNLAKQRVTRDLTCDERVRFLREDRVCPTPTPTSQP